MNRKPSAPDSMPVDRKPADAITPSGEVDQKKLKENQKRLQVDDEHKTPEMQKGHRGTFP